MNSGTKAGTAGGTLLTLIVNINNEDILRTAVLAIIGAVVSFAVSVLLKITIRLIRKHKQ